MNSFYTLGWALLACAAVEACAFQHVDVDGSSITVAPAVQQANGTSASLAVLTMQRGNGAVLADVSAHITGSGCAVQQGATATDANGVVTALVTSDQAGTCLLGATATLGGFSVNVASQTQVLFVTIPGPTAGFALVYSGNGNAVAGALSSPTLVAVDQFGNVTPSFVGSVAIQADDTTAHLPSSAVFTAANGGRVVLSNVMFRIAGPQKVTVHDAPAAHLDTDLVVHVEAAAPAGLLITTAPTAAVSCTALGNVTVVAQDAFGNTTSNAVLSVTLGLTHNATGARLSGTLLRSTTLGIAVFNDIQIDTPSQNYTLVASAPGVSSSPPQTLNVTAAPLPVITTLGPLVGHSACVRVPYTVSSLCPIELRVDVDVHGTGVFTRATQGPTLASTQGIHSVSPRGTGAYTFVWDAWRDLPRALSSTVTLRVRASTQDGAGAATSLANITIDNTAGTPCAWTWAAPQGVAVGGAIAVQTGDFNEDGRLDAVAISADTLNATVALGNGAGGLGLSVAYTVGGAAGHPAVFDNDGDGHVDIVVPSGSNHTLTLLAGDGTGAFNTRTMPQVFSSPVAADAVDVNADGITDLLVTDRTAGLWVLLGRGHGAYAQAMAYAAHSGAVRAVFGDVNRDGHVDALVTNTTSADVSVLLGDGAGGFAFLINVTTDANPLDAVLADFNADGNLDLAVAADGTHVNILLGDGTGHFAAPSNVGVAGATSLATADLNNDNRIDLAVVSSSQDSLQILLNNGAGTFHSQNYFAHLKPWALVLADMDGDAVRDVVYVSNSTPTPNILAVQLSDGVGGLVQAKNTALTGAGSGLTTADLNNDGSIDAVVGGAMVTPFLGDGSGGFVAQTQLAGGTSPSLVMTAAVSGSVYPQVVALDTTGFAVTSFVYKAASQALVSTGTSAVSAGAAAFALADFTGDNVADVVQVSATADTVGVSVGSLSGTYAAAMTFALAPKSQAQAVVAGDVDNNGHMDAVVAEFGTNAVAVFLGDGAGHLTAAATPSYSLTAPRALVLVDLNSDNNLDFVGLDSTACTGHVFLGAGTGTFKAAGVYDLGHCTGSTVMMSAGDADQDGHPDILVAYDSTATVGVLRGDGTGALMAPQLFVVPADHGAPRLLDANKDGRTDLMTLGFWFSNAVFFSAGR